MVTNPVNMLQRENARLKEENDKLQQELRNLRDFVSILNDLTAAAHDITSDDALLPLLRNVFRKALKLLNAPDGSLMLLDEDTNELVFVLVEGGLAEQLVGYRIPADQGIAGWVVHTGKPELVRDVRRDEHFYAGVDEAFKFRTQSVAAAPIIGDMRTYGVLEVLNKPGDTPLNESDMALLGLLCRYAGETLADIERKNPEQA